MALDRPILCFACYGCKQVRCSSVPNSNCKQGVVGYTSCNRVRRYELTEISQAQNITILLDNYHWDIEPLSSDSGLRPVYSSE